MSENGFTALEEVISELDEHEQARLERVTEGLEDTEFVNAMVNKETGSLRFVDEDGQLLMERKGFLGRK